MRIPAPPVKQPLLYRRIDRVRYLLAAARHPALRGTPMELGQGAHLMIAPDARINVGPGFRARRDLTLVAQGELNLGKGLFCNRGVVIAAMQSVTIGDDVRLGERVSVIDSDHVLEPLSDMHARFKEYETKPITIGNRALVSANCVILPGAQIGDDVVVAAGAVVRGTVPPRTLVAGVPAVVKRELR
ncbi:MAG TPA: acyltransferase [Solirubrobacteraceae bacterium]|jgi:acetyltransferase-like isoleucine patch superfamily enzyme